MSPSEEEIHALVREEAGDCLQRMESSLLGLESGRGGLDAVDAVLRDAHSIKGSAAMVGWDEAAAIASGIEDRVEQAREDGALPPEAAGALLGEIDALGRSLGIERGTPAEEPLPGSGEGAAGDPTIRVPAAKVDRMLDAVGETVLYHRRLEHALGGGGEAVQAPDQLDMGERLLDDLQESVVQMRTLPLSTITTPFPRAVRDLAAEEGKEVELEISGAETQLDRVILDGISEMIVHLLRNAVAHGIEAPAEREGAGKPPTGRLELRAEQRGGMVAIEVRDDGRGVSPELTALVSEGRSLADILAETGFSTQAEVTGVAGRGVGLDAVKRHVEGLSGSLDVQSEPGQGTTIVMLLPLTLALMRVLLFERGGNPFGLPVTSIGRVLAVEETTSLNSRPSLDLEGDVVPLADLSALIGAGGQPLQEGCPAVVVESLGRRLAVACDRLLGEEEVVIKSLGSLLAGLPGYLGAAILENGRIALVLDSAHLLKTRIGPSATAPAEQGHDTASARILVVDDQFSPRELQRGILETAGYEVEIARDGREALSRISESDRIELVLSDVQMPEMDGFELLEAIRADDERSSLPVVLVTTLGDDESRRRGAEAGADAYIVKEEFDQRTLLETVERLLGS